MIPKQLTVFINIKPPKIYQEKSQNKWFYLDFQIKFDLYCYILIVQLFHISVDNNTSMKNEPRFIPDNISGISGSSIQVQGLQNIDGTGYQSDSTDHLMS